MAIRKWAYGVLLAGAIATGSAANATIIWSNCPDNGFSEKGVCPIHPADDCDEIGPNLTECQCANHNGTWNGQAVEEERCQ